MRSRNLALALATVVLAVATAPAYAKGRAKPVAGSGGGTSGFLCCNMIAFGDEIYDINYEGDGSDLLPYGTPVTVTGQTRRKLRFTAGSKRYMLENHYSRDLSEAAFAARYVVAEDPRVVAAGFPEKIREAIAAARITEGMTREQVRMALGWPVSSENPDLDADVWRYWLSSFDEVQVEFGSDGRVAGISASVLARRKIWLP